MINKNLFDIQSLMDFVALFNSEPPRGISSAVPSREEIPSLLYWDFYGSHCVWAQNFEREGPNLTAKICISTRTAIRL